MCGGDESQMIAEFPVPPQEMIREGWEGGVEGLGDRGRVGWGKGWPGPAGSGPLASSGSSVHEPPCEGSGIRGQFTKWEGKGRGKGEGWTAVGCQGP